MVSLLRDRVSRRVDAERRIIQRGRVYERWLDYKAVHDDLVRGVAWRLRFPEAEPQRCIAYILELPGDEGIRIGAPFPDRSGKEIVLQQRPIVHSNHFLERVRATEPSFTHQGRDEVELPFGATP